MMQASKLMFFVICLIFISSLPTIDSTQSLLSFFNKKLINCGSGSCPPWKCQDDSAVIHGYCCGCPGPDDALENCETRLCPPWKCEDDPNYIHGQCCGCPGPDDSINLLISLNLS
ncbi:hypothetical protein PGB90_006673 [Kerria lacca]